MPESRSPPPPWDCPDVGLGLWAMPWHSSWLSRRSWPRTRLWWLRMASLKASSLIVTGPELTDGGQQSVETVVLLPVLSQSVSAVIRERWCARAASWSSSEAPLGQHAAESPLCLLPLELFENLDIFLPCVLLGPKSRVSLLNFLRLTAPTPPEPPLPPLPLLLPFPTPLSELRDVPLPPLLPPPPSPLPILDRAPSAISS